jgi:hypothetical protein
MSHLARLTRYIHLNPEHFDDYRRYKWSSYRQYASEQTGICDTGPVLTFFEGNKSNYIMFVENAATSGEMKRPRRLAGRRLT